MIFLMLNWSLCSHWLRKQMAASLTDTEELNISEKTAEGHMSKAIKEIRTDLAGGLPITLIYLLGKHWL